MRRIRRKERLSEKDEGGEGQKEHHAGSLQGKPKLRKAANIKKGLRTWLRKDV
jgi:hypothetical protein